MFQVALLASYTLLIYLFGASLREPFLAIAILGFACVSALGGLFKSLRAGCWRAEYFLFAIAFTLSALLAWVWPSGLGSRSAPLLISIAFFAFFAHALASGNYFLDAFIKHAPRARALKSYDAFLLFSHRLWCVALGVNVAIHMSVLFWDGGSLWAFYSLIGWYLFFGLTFLINFGWGEWLVYQEKRS